MWRRKAPTHDLAAQGNIKDCACVKRCCGSMAQCRGLNGTVRSLGGCEHGVAGECGGG